MGGEMRILAAMDTYLPLMDGVVNCMHSLLMSYPEGVEGSAFIPYTRNCPELPYEAIRYGSFHIPFTKNVDFGFPSMDRKALDKVMSMDLDLIHVHSPFGVMKALTGIARRKRIPIVATFHTNYRMVFGKIVPIKPISEAYIRKLGRRYSMMDGLFAGTQATREQLESFGCDKPCRIIPFGTGLRKPDDIDALAKEADRKFSICSDERVLLFVGRIVESKRVQFTLNALRKVKDSGRRFRFIICGEGNYAPRIRSLIRSLSLEDCCQMTGYVSQEDLEMLYSRSMLFLFPSILDNFGLVKVEAAQFSTPCLMIRGTNAAFGTVDGVNSILCDDDAGDFAKAVIWALDNPDAVSRIARAAESDLVFTWKQSAALYEREYARVIEEFKGGKTSGGNLESDRQ